MKFGVLGPLELIDPYGHPVQIRSKRARTLLGILLLNPGFVVPLESIVDGIWAAPPPSAVQNVRTYVHQLRTQLESLQQWNRLESAPGGYRLHARSEELDLLRFDELTGSGRRAIRRGDDRGGADLLDRALRLWRGSPLAGLELGPSFQIRTNALEEQRRSAQHAWIGARMRLGEHTDLLPKLRTLLDERPLDESLWQSLIVALHGAGRRAEALSTFAAARRMLVAELGVEPGPLLQQTHAAILQGNSLPEAPGSAGQLSVTVSVPRQLPPTSPNFSGRGQELRRIADLVTRSRGWRADRVGVAVLTGMPGIGKTRTAVAAAVTLREAFPDGQIFLDARGSTPGRRDSGALLSDALVSFGVDPAAVPDGLDQRQNLYRSVLAHRRALILIDDAADDDQVRPLLPGLGAGMVLVTSRRSLAGIQADDRLTLEPLDADAATDMLTHIVGPDRVRQNPEAVARILDMCDHLPLAISIIGARLAAHPEQDLGVLARRLSHAALEELQTADLSARAVVESAYRNLGEQERRCFLALGRIDPRRVTAAEVQPHLPLPVHRIRRLLERLADESILHGRPHSADPTYRMSRLFHDLARDLARRSVPASTHRSSTAGSA
ncbi:AfsR/SARP family transcriptional regulator [Catenuloplanes indicus]|uniref:DNA-binding SARP family transcriptional activator n=1 Tax=Catenuloplanes indicus TaxID=137267 RepID=A0AAE3VX80_9ACTN|nr:AfsR/SARP family transcriptional regulator [Catenuloplanes indicus]MDQ0364904.1 DNA-binding SARP family transcriptional activator [Catenuloplanes indicus]